MELKQILGNTWAIEADELIPFYKKNDREIILLDDGLAEEREALDALFAAHNLTPVGVLCSHAHVDHCANSGYLQKKYGTKIALTAPEAGMCSSLLTLKCYFLTMTAQEVWHRAGDMIHTPDVIIPGVDGPFSFCGVDFQIIQTPGHSAGHICTITPDRVLYTADAVLSWELMNSKLPYNLSHEMARQSREKLRGLDIDQCVLAHRGLCPPEELDALIDANSELLDHRSRELLALIDRPMTFSQIDAAACDFYQLYTKHTVRALHFERNVHFLTEYLVEHGDLTVFCQKGVAYYRPSREG